MYIDSHTHFDMTLEDKNLTEYTIIKNVKENEITHSVQVAVDVDNFAWSHDFAKKNRQNGVLFTLGIHPSSKAGDNELHQLENYIEKVIHSEDKDLLFGIGECGLDYYRMRQKKDMQQQSFRAHIALAKKHNMPLIVHSRDAMEDTLEIIKQELPVSGIMHCFPGDKEAAKKALDLGFFISYAGNVTYKNAQQLHESAAYVPLNRLLVETDAPFLTPVPLRGKKNRVEYITYTYAFISQLKNIPLATTIESVHENFVKIRDRDI